MHTWLKLIGSAQQPITGRYTDLSVGFRKKSKPGICKGDHLYLYAPGVHKRIFALAKATGNPERNDDYDPQVQGSCRWKLRIRYLINLPVAHGVHIDEFRCKRHLAASIRQQSHIKLRPEESLSADRKLRENRSEYIPPAIRVFPMGRGDSEVDSYPGARALQQGFFLERLPYRTPAGTFHYKTKGLQAPPKTLVLFQFEREIIASAIFVKSVRQPIMEGRILYKGVLYFDVNSIQVFKPVSWDTVRSIWKDAMPPSHVKQDLDPGKYFEFVKQLEEVRRVGDSITLANDFPDERPEKIKSYIYRIIRDTKKALKIKKDYDYTCQVCGQRLEIHGAPYAEAHHLKPLGGIHGGPDAVDNILCLCPNHHALFDYFAMPFEPGKIRLNVNHKLRPLFIKYHNEQVRNRSKDSV